MVHNIQFKNSHSFPPPLKEEIDSKTMTVLNLACIKKTNFKNNHSTKI